MKIHTKPIHGFSIVNLCFDNAKNKEEFILNIKNESISNIIPFVDTNHIPYEKICKKNTDFINPAEISSNLSVRDYLLFFSMIFGTNNDIAIDSIFDIITLYKNSDILNCDINSLSIIDKLFIRTIISYIKKSKFIIIDHEYSSKDQDSFLFDFFNQYLISKSSYCIFLTSAI